MLRWATTSLCPSLMAPTRPSRFHPHPHLASHPNTLPHSVPDYNNTNHSVSALRPQHHHTNTSHSHLTNPTLFKNQHPPSASKLEGNKKGKAHFSPGTSFLKGIVKHSMSGEGLLPTPSVGCSKHVFETGRGSTSITYHQDLRPDGSKFMTADGASGHQREVELIGKSIQVKYTGTPVGKEGHSGYAWKNISAASTKPQPECSKCLGSGHSSSQCQGGWTCYFCAGKGHLKRDCPARSINKPSNTVPSHPPSPQAAPRAAPPVSRPNFPQVSTPLHPFRSWAEVVQGTSPALDKENEVVNIKLTCDIDNNLKELEGVGVITLAEGWVREEEVLRMLQKHTGVLVDKLEALGDKRFLVNFFSSDFLDRCIMKNPEWHTSHGKLILHKWNRWLVASGEEKEKGNWYFLEGLPQHLRSVDVVGGFLEKIGLRLVDYEQSLMSTTICRPLEVEIIGKPPSSRAISSLGIHYIIRFSRKSVQHARAEGKPGFHPQNDNCRYQKNLWDDAGWIEASDSHEAPLIREVAEQDGKACGDTGLGRLTGNARRSTQDDHPAIVGFPESGPRGQNQRAGKDIGRRSQALALSASGHPQPLRPETSEAGSCSGKAYNEGGKGKGKVSTTISGKISKALNEAPGVNYSKKNMHELRESHESSSGGRRDNGSRDPCMEDFFEALQAGRISVTPDMLEAINALVPKTNLTPLEQVPIQAIQKVPSAVGDLNGSGAHLDPPATNLINCETLGTVPGSAPSIPFSPLPDFNTPNMPDLQLSPLKNNSPHLDAFYPNLLPPRQNPSFSEATPLSVLLRSETPVLSPSLVGIEDRGTKRKLFPGEVEVTSGALRKTQEEELYLQELKKMKKALGDPQDGHSSA